MRILIRKTRKKTAAAVKFEGFNGKPVKKSQYISIYLIPEEDINPGDDFERKKSSIAQNFGRKPAADKKRSEHMDQTVPKAAVERFKAAVDEKPNAPVMRKSTLVPENAKSRRERKAGGD